MKNKNFWLGILVIALVFGITVVGCDDDSTDDPSQVMYEGKDVTGNTYILTVTKKAGRAVYKPTNGDSYVLIIKITGQPDKKSSGNIKDISNDGTFTLQPSIKGSGTFIIIISSEKISSVSGDIALEGEEVITPRSFGTIYLRAERWTVPSGESGEQWRTGTSIKLSDFYTSTNIKDGDKIKISGTVDKSLEHFRIELQRVLGDEWTYIGVSTNNNSSTLLEIKSGSFDMTIPITISVPDNNKNEYGEFIIQLSNVMWQKNNNGEYKYNYGTIPKEIPENTIMATIRNFSISFVEK